MQNAYAEVQRLIAANARHRKGFRLNDLSDAEILEHVREEVNELADSFALNEPEAEQRREMADILGALLHIACRHGWSLESLDSTIVEKLALRFTV